MGKQTGSEILESYGDCIKIALSKPLSEGAATETKFTWILGDCKSV